MSEVEIKIEDFLEDIVFNPKVLVKDFRAQHLRLTRTDNMRSIKKINVNVEVDRLDIVLGDLNNLEVTLSHNVTELTIQGGIFELSGTYENLTNLNLNTTFLKELDFSNCILPNLRELRLEGVGIKKRMSFKGLDLEYADLLDSGIKEIWHLKCNVLIIPQKLLNVYCCRVEHCFDDREKSEEIKLLDRGFQKLLKLLHFENKIKSECPKQVKKYYTPNIIWLSDLVAGHSNNGTVGSGQLSEFVCNVLKTHV